MTCPFRDRILPTEGKLERAACDHVTALLDRDPRWEGDILSLATGDGEGSRWRARASPVWQVDPPPEGSHASLPFRGEGLLLPSGVEGLLRLIGESPESPDLFSNEGRRMANEAIDILETCEGWLGNGGVVKRLAAIRAFSESCSGLVLDRIFAWRFDHSHLPLAISLKVPGLDRLLDAHPQLTWLAARRAWDCGFLGTASMGELTAFWCQGPLFLTRVLGLPPGKATLSLLRRFHIGELGAASLLHDLRAVCADHEKRNFVLSLPPPLFVEDLAMQIAEPPPSPRYARALHEYRLSRPELEESHGCRYLTLESQIYFAASMYPEFRGILSRVGSLERFRREFCSHAGLVEALHEAIDVKRPLDCPFLDDPERGVEFVKTPLAIYNTARDFRNCAANLASAAMDGFIALYIIRDGPGRALLLLFQKMEGDWIAGSLLGPRNRPPAPSVVAIAHRWLKLHGIENSIESQAKEGEGT